MSRFRLVGLTIVAVGLVVAGWLAATRPTVVTTAGSAEPAVLGSLAPATPSAVADAARERAGTPTRSAATAPRGRWPEMLGGVGRPRPARLPPGSKAKAVPYVQPFAAQPGVRPIGKRPSPRAPMPVVPSMDGCDHNYGTRIQCIPWTFPDGVTDKCAWLAEHGYKTLKVSGTDRQKLDPDGNRTACD